jgi:glucose-6-phosphate isomerase
MEVIRLDQLEAHEQLARLAGAMQQPSRHLKHLIASPNRLKYFSAKGAGLFFDYSRQRLDEESLAALAALATPLDLHRRFNQMCSGELINVTEKRAVLHTAARSFGDDPIRVQGRDVLPDIRRVRDEIKDFSSRIHGAALRGAGGRPFRHAVVVGIGGSYLGTEFVSTALAAYADKEIQLHYLSNVDIHNFAAVVNCIDPAATLWVIISKSYTTAETVANTLQVETYMRAQGLEPGSQMVTVTAKGSPGDDPSRPVLQSFHMFDFIGGRYSVTSAVGALPLSLYLGYDRFEEFLKGAAEMDQHARSAPVLENLPMLAALVAVWNTTYLGYHQQAIIPYAAPLAKLAPHIQQLHMESNGKAVDLQGRFLPQPAGTVIFGEPGTNAQHSFFQLAHQGRPFPVDFIGVLKPQYSQYHAMSRGVTNHQELWANMLAQAQALAVGADNPDSARSFSGNRPSSTIVLEDLSPRNVGRLLSFYEARTVYEGFIWGVNSFDQFGVQLGKTVASGLRSHMAEHNRNPAWEFPDVDPIAAFYLDLFLGQDGL